MEHKVHAPDVTTKHGQLKAGRKSRKDAIPTVDDLATLEVLNEVRGELKLLGRF